jgi:hypothetical protein
MKKFACAFAFAVLAVTPAFADEPMQSMRSETACLDLMRQAEAGLRSNNTDDIVRERLKQMLDTGRSGNLRSCQDVMNGSLASPKLEGKSCEKPAV